MHIISQQAEVQEQFLQMEVLVPEAVGRAVIQELNRRKGLRQPEGLSF
jgi:hypothetical protein